MKCITNLFVSVSVVLGIPTVRREVQSYLLATLQNIIDSMTQAEQNDTLIVIFIAEVWDLIFHFLLNNLCKKHNECC